MADEDHNGSVPLIALQGRHQYSRVGDNHTLGPDIDTSYPGPSYSPNMARSFVAAQARPRKQPMKSGIMVAASYAFDWIIIIVILGVSAYVGNHNPNRRPFSLEDPNISFPYTEHETVPPWLLIVCCAVIPIVIIPIIALIFVPGNTVPHGTPRGLVWRRKLWELHVGWLGLALALASTWAITNGMKNLFGKPRPDMLSRCNPDLANWEDHIVGGLNVDNGYHRLVAASICQGVDGRDLADGFRSYPSGHSSASAAGLIYLSLFIASKFAITFPFLPPSHHGGGGRAGGSSSSASAFSAFPSRLPRRRGAGNPQQQQQPTAADGALAGGLLSQHNDDLASARRQAAGPPVYLLIFAVAPFFAAIFISSSRWFDFRHHGFDILFGFLIGTVCAFFAFRWYHLPMSQGAGWAWGPRCADKAFWAGVGSFSYALDWERYEEEEEAAGMGMGTGAGMGAVLPVDEQVAMEEGHADKTRGPRLDASRMGTPRTGTPRTSTGSGGSLVGEDEIESRRRAL